MCGGHVCCYLSDFVNITSTDIAIPERLRGVFTTRRYINPRLPLPLPLRMYNDNPTINCRNGHSCKFNVLSYYVELVSECVLIHCQLMRSITWRRLHRLRIICTIQSRPLKRTPSAPSTCWVRSL